MDDEQFADMILRTNKNDEVIVPTFSQIVILCGVFIGSLLVIYYTTA